MFISPGRGNVGIILDLIPVLYAYFIRWIVNFLQKLNVVGSSLFTVRLCILLPERFTELRMPLVFVHEPKAFAITIYLPNKEFWLILHVCQEVLSLILPQSELTANTL